MGNSIHDYLDQQEQDRIPGKTGLARRLPRKVYSEPGIHELEYSRWLDTAWLMVGRAHEIPNAGTRYRCRGIQYF